MITSVLAPLRPAARIFTGSTYVLLGFDALRAPGARVEQAGPVLAAVRRAVPLPEDDELVVRANAAVQVVCGAMLAMGRAPRLASLALAPAVPVGAVVETARLEIPHPRIAERRFVLAPLAELAPDLRHPVTHRSVRQMLESAPPAVVRLLHS